MFKSGGLGSGLVLVLWCRGLVWILAAYGAAGVQRVESPGLTLALFAFIFLWTSMAVLALAYVGRTLDIEQFGVLKVDGLAKKILVLLQLPFN